MALGFSEDEFWRKTPRQIDRAFRGAVAAEERRHNLFAWHAWHVVAMPRMKKLPKLEKLQFRKRNRKLPTPDQMWAMMMSLTYTKH